MPVLTHLHAQLSPSEMAQDAVVTWKAFAEKKPRIYTYGAAFLLVLTGVSAVFLMLLMDCTSLVMNPATVRPRLNSRGILLVTAICGVVAFCLIPKTVNPTMISPRGRFVLGPAEMRHRYAGLLNSTEPITLAVMQKQLEECFANPEKLGDGPEQYYLRIEPREHNIQLIYVMSVGTPVVADVYGPERPQKAPESPTSP